MSPQTAENTNQLAQALLEHSGEIAWVKRSVLIEMVGPEAAKELLPAEPETVAVNKKTTLSKCDQSWLNALSNSET